MSDFVEIARGIMIMFFGIAIITTIYVVIGGGSTTGLVSLVADLIPLVLILALIVGGVIAIVPRM